MSSDATSYAPLLLEMIEKTVEDTTYKNFPFYALVEKDKTFGGESLRVPVGYEDAQGGSVGFTEAQTGAAASSDSMKAFSVTHANDYSVARISGPLIRRSKGNGMAILEASKYAIDRAMRNLARSIAHKGYRRGYGDIGPMLSVSGSTFKMLYPEDIIFLQKGMRIVFADDPATGGLRSATAVTITAVDEDANVVTCSATMASVSAVAGDFPIRIGDGVADGTRVSMSGFGAWVPGSAYRPASSGDSFFGVDRYAHPSRLAGQYWSAGATPPEEVVLEAVHRVARRGEGVTHLFCPFGFYRALAKATHGRREIVQIMATEKIGFKAIHVVGTEGEAVVMPDIMCPADTIAGVDIDSWKLATAGDTVSLADEDDLKLQRVSSADEYEVRFVSHGNWVCKNPNANINVTITPYV
jgi:hypothetical protein